MLQTKDLILDKAKFSDWKQMYRNVWSRPECAEYMTWRITTNEENAKERILKTIEFQKTHDTYLVYQKATSDAIGFAGVEQLEPGIFTEAGICICPDYQRKGYGAQILQCLITYCKEQLHAKEFIYSTREENEASEKLARSFGFELQSSEEKTCQKSGRIYRLHIYRLIL